MDIQLLSPSAAATSQTLKANIAAFPKNKDITMQKPKHDKIVRDFISLVNTIKEFLLQSGSLKYVDAETVTDGVTRKKLKLCQRAIECLEAGLQVHFKEMKKAKVLKEHEAKEFEEDLVSKCGVDMEKDYKVGSKLVEYLKAIKIALVG